MLPPPFDRTIEYELYAASDADDMVRLLGQAFACHDPLAVAVGLEPSEF